jgi:hypothetical protein
MIELLISFLCLASLIVVLLEMQAVGGFRRRWPLLLWTSSLALLGLHVLVRIYQNLDFWSPERVLMSILAAGNFFVAVILLLRGLFSLGGEAGGTAPNRPGR